MGFCAAIRLWVSVSLTTRKKRGFKNAVLEKQRAKNLPQHFCPQRVYRKSANNVQSAIHYQTIMTRTLTRSTGSRVALKAFVMTADGTLSRFCKDAYQTEIYYGHEILIE